MAVARRVRGNYLWILLIQSIAYLGKLMVHPTPAASLAEFLAWADIGPIPGAVILSGGAAYILLWAALAVWITRVDAARVRARGGAMSMG